MRRLWPWLRLLLALGVLAALGLRLGVGAFADGLRAITVESAAAALAIGAATTVLSAGRWCVVARRLGLPLRLTTAVADYYRSQLLNAVLPAGVLGDVHRAVSHGRRSGDVGRGVSAVVVERAVGQVVLVGIVVVVLAARPELLGALSVSWTAVAVAAAVVAIALGAVLLARDRVARLLADVRVAVVCPRTLPAVVALSTATVAGYVALLFVAARAAGSSAPAAELLPLFAVALLAMAIPVNVGGWGPREALLAMGFGATGLGAAQGLTTAVVYGVLALIACLPGVVVLLRVSTRSGGTAREAHRAPASATPWAGRRTRSPR